MNKNLLMVLGWMVVPMLAAGLSGCKPESAEAQTVDWYKAHNAERQETLAKCNNHAGDTALAPDCVNAGQADADVTWNAKGTVKPLAPLTASDMKKN